MERGAYGLPIGLEQNSPYGLRASRPAIPMPVALAPVALAPPPGPAPPFALGPIGGPGGIGGMLPPSNVLPFRATEPQPLAPGEFPVVGKNITLQQLTQLQRDAESSGNYQAINTQKKGNTASGAYQYTDGTWNGYGGYGKAMLAPKAVQDRRFDEDVSNRVNRYNGDMFKSLAAHYLPAQANNPRAWSQPAKVRIGNKTITVGSVENYLRHVLKGSPYLEQLDAYLKQ